VQEKSIRRIDIQWKSVLRTDQKHARIPNLEPQHYRTDRKKYKVYLIGFAGNTFRIDPQGAVVTNDQHEITIDNLL